MDKEIESEKKKHVEWQRFVDQIDVSRCTGMAEKVVDHIVKERAKSSLSIIIIILWTLFMAGALAYCEIVGGEIISGLLGVSIGYLLSRKSE